jgi:hypothetical protein
MKSFPGRRCLLCALLVVAVGFGSASNCRAQNSEVEHIFPQSKTTVEQALKAIENATAGRLPLLDGFAASNGNSLDRYQRGYYQAKIQVSPTSSGGSVVRVGVEITAWYNDPAGTHSGYQLLPSNGRLEADILDQLAQQVAALRTTPAATESRRSTRPAPGPAAVAMTAKPASARPPATASTYTPKATQTVSPTGTANGNTPSLSAPTPRLPDEGGGLLASMAENQVTPKASGSGKTVAEADERELRAEAEGLEEVLKNQAHPTNLVAVKKSGTPVVASASLTAKTLFLASAHDEFEMLDFTRDWVHVRISGLSRGWIWRNNVEMPDDIPDNDLQTNASAEPVAADLFQVAREEKAPFPGDWEPLRGKTVKIVSVEKTDEARKDDGPQLRLEFAKWVLDRNLADLEQHSDELGGIVLIFDSADGGMIAATLSTLQQWKAGKFSDAALWHQCFFDPPESFTTSTASASH